jgi:flagellar basal body P-ring formation protein FlgA
MLSRFIAVLISVLCGVAGADQDVLITLNPRASVEAQEYSLRDVAEITAADPLWARDLAEIKVGDAPPPGISKTVTRAELARYIVHKFPELNDRLAWGGADAVSIKSYGTNYDQQAVMNYAAQVLRNRITPGSERVEIETFERFDPVLLPKGKVTLQARDSHTGHLFSKKMPVIVDVMVDGKFVRSVQIWFGVKVFHKVYTARFDMDKGYTPKIDDFETQTLDVTELGAAPVAVGKAPVGQRLKKMINSGAALTYNVLENAPAISRGQEVTIELKSGTIVLQSRGQAQSEARVGQIVRVKTSSNEAISAMVIAPGVVSASPR